MKVRLTLICPLSLVMIWVLLLHSHAANALLIASIGDSYASGEGNPDEPQRYGPTGIDVSKGPVWTDRQCHRSHVAAPEIAANAIARHLNQPLTYIGLACTGARLDRGLLGPYDPDTDKDNNPLPAQIEALRQRVGNQRIDVLLISAGGNDIGFSDIIKACIKIDAAAMLRGRGKLCPQDGITAASVAAELAFLPSKYDQLAARLKTLQVGEIYITEYPDLTKGTNGEYCGDKGNDRILHMHPQTAKWAHDNVLIPLNAAIGAAAEKHGWIRVPVMAWSTRNGYCAREARWFRTEEDARNIQGPYELGLSPNDLLKPGFQFSMGSIHPNPAGQQGIAKQILATYIDWQKNKDKPKPIPPGPEVTTASGRARK